MKQKYYKYLDFIRVIACFFVLFYHLNILPGGYLAVCTFLVLSGYLNVRAAFQKENFSLKKYYISRFKRLYIPLCIIVFLSISLIFAFTNFQWINLKPEVTSVLFGYNNYWQLSANLNYFVRNISSPFMHLWYISLLLQFELLFPLIFIGLKWLGKRVNQLVPCIWLLLLGIISGFFFYQTLHSGNIMRAYYSTFNRSFSLFFGMLIGFLHTYYKPLVISNKNYHKKILLGYFGLFILLCLLIDSNSILFPFSMFIITFVSIRIIDYAVCQKNIDSPFYNMVSSLSKCSYEIYLIQYPIIFLFQDVPIPFILKIILIIIITFSLSGLLHYVFSTKGKDQKFKHILMGLILLLCSVGLYQYVTAKNYQKDQKKLESDLNHNQKLIKQRQQEYREKQKEEQEQWDDFLKQSEAGEKDLENVVRNLRIVGIGDSIMELAIKDLYKEFPNGYFDAEVNRTEHVVPDILQDLASKGIEADAFLFNVGTNGLCSESCKEKLLDAVGDKKLFWVNATSPDYDSFNPTLEDFANKHDNVYIIDWKSIGDSHPEYLIYDKVHPTVHGCEVYAETLFQGVYQQYLDEFKNTKEKKIAEHNEQENNKITFIGNNLLLEVYDSLNNRYQNTMFIIDEDFTYQSLREKLQSEHLSNTIVFAFDNRLSLTQKQYQELIRLCEDKNIFIINTGSTLKFSNRLIKVIDFDINSYTTSGQVTLNQKGKKELLRLINRYIKEELWLR